MKDRLELEEGRRGRVLTFTLSGVLTPEGFVRVVAPLLDSDEYASSPRLWDFRATDPAVSSADVFVMGKVIGDGFRDTPSVAAYLTHPGVSFMKFETYRRARASTTHIRKVFTDMDEAIEWLENQEIPHPPFKRDVTTTDAD